MARTTIITAADFGALVDRTARNITDLATYGLLAPPTHNYRNGFAWEYPQAIGWFASLHDHAVIVPGSDLAAQELAHHGVYMCPLTSNHVGLARPRQVLVYRSGTAEVFDVTVVETVNQNTPGTQPTSPNTLQIMRDGVAIGSAKAAVPYTVFHLKSAGSIGTVTPVVQQGRYVPLTGVENALKSGRLTLTKLSEAFSPIEQ